MSKKYNLTETISIIGLYKNGTSWLLSVLCHHPEIVGIREFDVVRAILGDPRDPFALNLQPEILNRFFCQSPWCKVPTSLLEETANLSPEEAVDIWASKLRKKLHLNKITYSKNKNTPQTFFDLERTVAAQFIRNVREATCEKNLSSQFIEAINSYSTDAKYSVMKAADQVAVFDRLQYLTPSSKKILIIRDGRDAAISAFHYRNLMKEKNPPWFKNREEKDLLTLFKSWRSRAHMTRRLIEAGEDIYVLRYEDLSNNFHQELSNLLDWLELDSSQDLVSSIYQATNFKNITGRERGTEAKNVIRKGQTGEWLEVYSQEEREQAWNMAGDVLTYFGYSKDGGLQIWNKAA